MMFSTTRIVFALLFLTVAVSAPAFAQQKDDAGKQFQTKALASGAASLRAGENTIRLWGVDAAEGTTARQRIAARAALDNLIGNRAVQCEMTSRSNSTIVAQCVNASDIDIGLFMLQNGHVVADRSAVYGTAFEEPYINAERQAQTSGAGLWAAETAGDGGNGETKGLLIAAVGLLALLLAGFGFLTIVVISGLKKIISGQDRSIGFLTKERDLRVQERRIVASMLDAELRANKSKIEAYLVIYEEMLKNLREPEKAHQYTKAGDIVQMQPALDRAVFERNTDKMDLLGKKLCSEVIHFYARIKTNPDYVNLNPDMPAEEAVAVVDRAVKSARHLDDILRKVIENFIKAGIGQEL
jgi:endonuclease YncB( thermonuclease family)